uniref:Uncharacterized protein n=1 Tax=Oryza sativa subsp. japonica TaxID=39947 RepID=Q6K556_ORYSJ|nr:hypothetical protein [Oryza sativa Japonica Group]
MSYGFVSLVLWLGQALVMTSAARWVVDLEVGRHSGSGSSGGKAQSGGSLSDDLGGREARRRWPW